jgi:8-oxo-dGTP pyrophosphatase MutT (NUDIX family)
LNDLRFDAEEVKERASKRLLARAPTAHRRGDDDLNPHLRPLEEEMVIRAAAVLVPIVARKPEATVLLTQRTEHLAMHAGQIAFPGGSVDARDVDPVMTALRETREETGLGEDFVEPIGFLEAYLTRSNFRIVPVVGLVTPGFALAPAREEVASVFEVPLRFLMTPKNHAIHSRQWLGRQRLFHAISFGDRYIWGATAGMLRNFYERMYASEAEGR